LAYRIEGAQVGSPSNPIGGFDFYPDGDMFLWNMEGGRFFRYEADDQFTTYEVYDAPVNDNRGSVRANLLEDYYYFHEPRSSYFLIDANRDYQFERVIVIDYHRIGLPRSAYRSLSEIPFGPLLLLDLDEPGNEHSIEIFPEDPDREPEYRDAAATRELIEERGEELGLYYDSRGYLWARDEPHDWLVTSNPETFNEAFGLHRRRGAYGEFAGRDKAGNYYWGGPARYKVMSPDGRLIVDVDAENPDIGAFTGMRVNADGVLMFFAYNSKAYNYEKERLDLYRLDTGIITGR
jgi:hypothetical protein